MGLTRTGNTHACMLLIEASCHHRTPNRPMRRCDDGNRPLADAQARDRRPPGDCATVGNASTSAANGDSAHAAIET